MSSSLKRFRSLIENSPDAISLVNPEGKVMYASASTAKILGYQPKELLGRNGLDLLHPQDRDRSLETLKKVLAQPQSHNRMEARVRQKDGQWRWVESTASNLIDEPHVGAIVLNYREIGTRRAEEKEKLRLAHELIRSNAALRAFAHTVAHDLREPLRTIAAFTQILARKAPLEQADKQIAQNIVDAVGHLSTLLDDLLFSATSGFSALLRPVELEHAAAQATQNLTEACTSSGATVTIGQLPTVQGNESDLVRLFQNLIGNAVKYRSEAAVEVHIAAERVGPNWVIRIRDNGIGIAKENHRRIFDLYTRLHSDKVPGTGIGLDVCMKIVEGWGGTIWVESELGLGSTFYFTVAADRTSRTRITDASCSNAARLPW